MPRRTPLSREEQNARRREFYERIERGDMSIAEAMKAMRKMTGLTQAEFAAHRGVSRRVIQDIERGTGNPTVESLNSIGKLFGLQVGFVRLRRSEPPVTPAE
ncbi:helix-turn-helix domain-containing protein [Burkholderia sp. Ax-1719]|jgi:DNA-binding XRE family transcriptional regulator|uniref:helix-turn-helix domain-containing protein n=1 Tax=Burkholderia sp. Ax-1719 TaxID=2608334 RepID=UPI001422EA18|nr:helix-turn-helix domain-containing protein [Burkholderia sp. Ax-1719]NIE63010.1 helix-turn-helix transcriptional regulator [Burkholderia sp. Ax-1719]